MCGESRGAQSLGTERPLVKGGVQSPAREAGVRSGGVAKQRSRKPPFTDHYNLRPDDAGTAYLWERRGGIADILTRCESKGILEIAQNGDLSVTVRAQVEIEFSAGNNAVESPDSISSSDVYNYAGLTADLDAFLYDVTRRKVLSN